MTTTWDANGDATAAVQLSEGGRMRSKATWCGGAALLIVAWAAPWAAAQGVEEIVVTAARATESAPLPGAYLKRSGDFVLLEVAVTNDTREKDARKSEIYETLRTALAAAKRDGSIELSVVDDAGLVMPLKVDSASVILSAGDRPDTSRTTISVKTRIPLENANGSALIAKLKDFVSGIKPAGRTLLSPNGDVEISIVNPGQYRDRVIALFAEDVRKVTGAIGDEYKVIVRGIDRPIAWRRMGLLELALYIPYNYAVIPATVTGYTHVEE